VLRPRPRAICLNSLAVRQPAYLRPASFIQSLRNQTLPFATLATIRPGVELIPCLAPPYLAQSSATHGGTRDKQCINKQPGKPGTQPDENLNEKPDRFSFLDFTVSSF